MANQDLALTFIGQQIGKRLKQLGLSRRELCRRVKLSRQTLHSLEHDSTKRFNASTFQAIDEGLKWPAGTAEAFSQGVANAKDVQGGLSTEERIANYVTSILTHVMAMSVDDLEREVLMLEEETYGQVISTDQAALAVIRETVDRLANAMVRRLDVSKQGNGE